MTQKLLVSVVLLASLVFSACGADRADVHSLANALQKELGIVVGKSQVNANDKCMLAQMNSLYNEFKGLSSSARSQLKSELRGVLGRINLFSSKQTQHISGERVTLSYVRNYIDGRRDWIVSKDIGKSQTVEGENSGTAYRVIDWDNSGVKVFTMRAGFYNDESVRRHYITPYVDIYDRVEDISNQSFVVNRQKENLWLSHEDVAPSIGCGPMINLNDISLAILGKKVR